MEVSNLQQSNKGAGAKVAPLPLVERLSEYPSEGVNLENIVVYPPKLDAIPVKPLFLDVAWNYIDYPAKQAKVETKAAAAPHKAASAAAVAAVTPAEEAKPQKRGWFGFGR